MQGIVLNHKILLFNFGILMDLQIDPKFKQKNRSKEGPQLKRDLCDTDPCYVNALAFTSEVL